MWTIQNVKDRGKSAFKLAYWRSVIAALLLTLLVSGATASGTRHAQESVDAYPQEVVASIQTLSPSDQRVFVTAIVSAVAVTCVVSLLLKIFVFNPLQVGCYRFFQKNVDAPPAELGEIKAGFSAYGHVFGTLLLRDIFLFLWSLLLIVPGIVKSYSYKMVPYIIKDCPELSATEVITRSREMMKGNKWRAFVLDLSFLGWFLLGAVTFGLVNLFWTQPYYENTQAALYLELSNKG